MDTTPPLPSDSLLARFAPLAPVEPGSPVQVHLARDVFALWEAWEQESGSARDVPYWALPWPAAIAFCRLLAAQPDRVRGKRVVEVGCGGAAAAIAACLAGATQVTANDTDPVALHIARRNAAANGVSLALDGRDLSATGVDATIEVALVADLFYERGPAARMLGCLREAAGRGTDVLVADAGRPFAPHADVEVLAVETVAVDDDLEGTARRTVHILRLLAIPGKGA